MLPLQSHREDPSRNSWVARISIATTAIASGQVKLALSAQFLCDFEALTIDSVGIDLVIYICDRAKTVP